MNKKSLLLTALVVLVVSLVIYGCGPKEPAPAPVPPPAPIPTPAPPAPTPPVPVTEFKVKLIPEKVEMDIGQSQEFSAEVTDDYGNLITDAQLTWEVADRLGTITEGGILTAGTKAGSFEEGVFVTATLNTHSTRATASVTVRPDPLDSVEVPSLEIAAGETQQLEVIAIDQYKNRLSEFDVDWTTVDENAGLVTETGLLTAGKVAGTFSEAIEAKVTQGGVIRTTVVPITIVAGTLEQIVIAPNPAAIGMEMTQQFVAVGADQYGNRISDLALSWSVENDGGTIDKTGLFTAGTAPGTYEGTVKAETTQGSVTRSGTANVTVEPDRIVFISGSDVRMDIYVMDADGGNVKQLTDTSVTEGKFSCSPDGRRIVYDSGGSRGKIMVINTDGSQKLSLISNDNDNASPDWSPDGIQIVFSSRSRREEQSDIYVIDADGGNLTQLTDTSKRSEGSPVWSPDGTRIVFSSDNLTEEHLDIYVIDADGGNLTQLTHTSGYSEQGPVWSPDGTQIVFSFRGDIYVINADGSNRKRLETRSSSPTWSPDGAQIVFSCARDGDYEIYVMDADGTNRRQLTATGKAIDDTQPAWSPDDSKVVYVSSKRMVTTQPWETRSFIEIYVMNADGSHRTQITDNKDEERRPKWVPRKRGVEVTEDSVIIPD